MVPRVTLVLMAPPCPDNVKISANGSVISITGAHVGNQGAYHCVASNRFGVASSVVNLVVQGMRWPGGPVPVSVCSRCPQGTCVPIPMSSMCPQGGLPLTMLVSSMSSRYHRSAGVPVPISFPCFRCFWSGGAHVPMLVSF